MRVLLVDDDDGVRTTLAALLRDAFPHAHIVDVDSAKSAIEIIETTAFDIVIADVFLESRDAGWRIARAARARAMPVVLLSGEPAAATLGDLPDVALVAKSELVHMDVNELVTCVLATQTTPPHRGAK
jgi:CheY-like chemotaxis protein